MGQMKKMPAALLVLPLVALVTFACTPAQADLVVAIEPTPVLITGFNPGHGFLSDNAQWSVRVTEMAGLGGDIVSFQSVVVDVATGAPVGEVTSSASLVHVKAHESVTIDQRWGVPRVIGDAFRPRRFEVTLRFQDDKGNLSDHKATAPSTYQ